jgi:2-methylcitrate dehydratase PrpD
MLNMSRTPQSHQLASFLSSLQIADLPGRATELLKLCLLDTIGCALGGRDTEIGIVIDKLLRRIGQGGPCTVVGSPVATAPEAAALANGVLAHALVFDDLHRHAKLHPGVATIPAALAAAELGGASGEMLLIALAAGYETTVRLGIAVDMASHRHKGWRATGTAGSFGAAAAVARLLNLNAEAFHHALAAAAAQASGNWAFQKSGGMELYLAAGTAARNGLVSAFLAEAGFRGADDPLTARDGGFFGLTSDSADPSQISKGLGAHFRLLDTCIKMYPTCHSTQTGIDASINLRAKHGIRLGDVDRIVVRAGEITRLQCGWPYEPATPAKLIFHMGYAMALAIRNGMVRPADFEGKLPHDPELVRVATATEVIADAELTAIYAERKPCDVTIHLRDGRTLRERVDYCRGEPENPPEPTTVIAKFRENADAQLGANALDEIADRILGLEHEVDLAPLMRLLANRGRETASSAEPDACQSQGKR